MDKTKEPVTSPFGALHWCGVMKGLPAFVGGYYRGASLYVFNDNRWELFAEGKTCKEVTPHKCKECGTELPLESEVKDK